MKALETVVSTLTAEELNRHFNRIDTLLAQANHNCEGTFSTMLQEWHKALYWERRDRSS